MFKYWNFVRKIICYRLAINDLAQQVLLQWQGSERERTRREKVKRIEDREDTKIGTGRSCISYVLCETSLLRSIASSILFSGGNGTETGETIMQWNKVSMKLIKQCCTGRTQGISRALQTWTPWLRTTNSSPVRWERAERIKEAVCPGERPLLYKG